MAATRPYRARPQAAAARGGTSPHWLVVHGLHDTAAPALVDLLALAAQARGVVVQAVSLPALMAGAHWWLRVQGDGSCCTLDAPGLALRAGGFDTGGAGAGAEAAARNAWGAPRARLAGVVNRCGPVVLPAGAPDADYKSAEWNALLTAWLHGLPCPVINRPRPRNLQAATMGPARWRQAAATCGLPVWALHGQQAWPQAQADSVGLLVVGQQVFEADAPAGPRWPARAHRAAAAAAAHTGCDLLAWTGRPDAQGQWRISGATPWPDLRRFGPAAAAALAQALGEAS